MNLPKAFIKDALEKTFRPQLASEIVMNDYEYVTDTYFAIRKPSTKKEGIYYFDGRVEDTALNAPNIHNVFQDFTNAKNATKLKFSLERLIEALKIVKSNTDIPIVKLELKRDGLYIVADSGTEKTESILMKIV